jgi:hypothetical protein
MKQGSFFTSLAILAAVMAVFAAPCRAAEAGAEGSQSATPAPEAVWAGLLERQPYPYRIPLPEPKRTSIDGTYTKVVPALAERVHCLRCPDYAPEGGVWKLRFDRGVYRIFHPESRWKSIGTAIVSGDRLLLANDPTCIEGLGLYAWRMDEGCLVLEVIDDSCAIRLRAVNLTQMPWNPCRPPNVEAAVTEHWVKPQGCE